MIKFWALMRMRYGNSWHFGDEPNLSWISDLKTISDNDILKGFRSLKEIIEYKDWPPKSIAFYQICKPIEKKEIRQHKWTKYDRTKESNELIKEIKRGLK